LGPIVYDNTVGPFEILDIFAAMHLIGLAIMKEVRGNRMNKSLLLGWGHLLLRIPRPIWQQEIARSARARGKSLAFMTPDHHHVRDFVVRELPRLAEPIYPELIAQKLNMGPQQVILILDELEKNLTFLFRNDEGAVT
jgi:hypothetical protein